ALLAVAVLDELVGAARVVRVAPDPPRLALEDVDAERGVGPLRVLELVVVDLGLVGLELPALEGGVVVVGALLRVRVAWLVAPPAVAVPRALVERQVGDGDGARLGRGRDRRRRDDERRRRDDRRGKDDRRRQ